MFAHLSDKRLFAVVMASVLCLAFWQLGRGAYIPAKAWVAQELMQRAWRRAESGDREPPPWPWADTWPVARLTAPGGGPELIVLEGESGRTLAFGPGHLGASVLPGERGNSIIAGHRDTHFRFLQHVREGDSLSVDMPDGRGHLFRVVNIDVVDSRRGSILLDTGTPMLSLVTCYPFDARDSGGPMRYVVTAEMVY
ncbi:MAG TPA: class GN sortase [Woeseiaceae bacterium]|nr:class GN sortase [Woeseiaceae bacterium]